MVALISKATEIKISAMPKNSMLWKISLPLPFAIYVEDSDKIKSSATDGIWESVHDNYPFFGQLDTMIILATFFILSQSFFYSYNFFQFYVLQIGISNSLEWIPDSNMPFLGYPLTPNSVDNLIEEKLILSLSLLYKSIVMADVPPISIIYRSWNTNNLKETFQCPIFLYHI